MLRKLTKAHRKKRGLRKTKNRRKVGGNNDLDNKYDILSNILKQYFSNTNGNHILYNFSRNGYDQFMRYVEQQYNKGFPKRNNTDNNTMINELGINPDNDDYPQHERKIKDLYLNPLPIIEKYIKIDTSQKIKTPQKKWW